MASIPDSSDGPNSADNVAMKTLNSALDVLQGGLGLFPPLKTAVGELIECMVDLQVADHNRREYEQLASNLASLANRLQARLSQAIAEQARHIQMQQNRYRSRTRRLAAAKEDDGDVLRCFRRVEALFQQLQMDISLSIWDVVQEQQMDTRLKDLSPADDAWYNSALPAAMVKRRGCTPNTRTKVLADAYIWTREEDAAKIYWMNGMAGIGKTTIAYSLCKRLEDDKQLGASFFCSRDSPNCRDVNKIVPTIAYQLGRYSTPYRQALCDALNNHPDVAKKDIGTQFENLILKPIEECKKAMPNDLVVVIDGLDECTDVNGMDQVLELLFRHVAAMPIKFFISSRPEPSILDRVIPRDDNSRSILHLHNIERSLVEADIKTYLNEALLPARFSPAEIDQLATRAGSLFIFAATAVRYILPVGGRVNHRQRLSSVLGLHSNPGNKSYRDIDKLYLAILSSALDKENLEDPELAMRQQVLWTVVCAREPLAMSTIAELLGLTDDQEVQLAIQPLQSVLHVSENTGVVSTLHASFPDFLLNEQRAGPSLYCNEAQHNSYLATCCFEMMVKSLRFNICELETSHRLDKDAPNLQSRVNNAISPGLFYACRYWDSHLLSAVTPTMLLPSLVDFLQHRLLFWMEVLNLKGWIGHGEKMLTQVLRWLPAEDRLTELRQFTYDARNFITTFAGNPTSLSTPHIYLSVLPFTPKQSHVWRSYWPRMRGLLRVEGEGVEARGRAALATWAVGSPVHSIALSSDGKRIVSGSDDHLVSVWDVSDGNRILGPMRGHKHRVLSVAFSPDAARIASSSEDSTILLWDSHNGSLIAGPLSGHIGAVRSVAFSHDGARLVSGSSDRTIRMWDSHKGTPLGRPFDGHRSWVKSVAFAPDDKRIVSGSSDLTIRIWDSHAGTTIIGPLEGHTSWVHSVAFSPDGLRVVSGSEDHTIRIWDARSGTMLIGPLKSHVWDIQSVGFSPDGTRVVSGSQDHTIRVWDAEAGTLLGEPFQGHRGSISSVMFSTDGTRIFSGSYDGKICVWDARLKAAMATRSPGHAKNIRSVAFSPDGTHIVSGSVDNTIRVWDTRDGALVAGSHGGHTDGINSVAFSPDGARIVSGSSDCTLCTWDAYTGALLVGPFKGHIDRVNSVSFSPDGNHIVSGSDDKTIRMWNSHTGAPVAESFIGHTWAVMSVVFSPDGTRIVSGSQDRTIRMWHVQDGNAPAWTSTAHIDPVNCVAYSSDGARVVSGSADRTILVLDAHDGRVLHGPFEGHTDEVCSVALSLDGSCIVSGSLDRTAYVRDALEGRITAGPFNGHTGDVNCVAISPDGGRVVSCSNDCTIRFWELVAETHPHAAHLDQRLFNDDGWLTDSNGGLLLWAPPDLRTALPRPSCSLMICPSGAIHAYYDDLLLGERWRECYRNP